MTVSLAIDHFDLKYRVPRGHPAVVSLEKRLNSLVAGPLCASWEKYLAASVLDEPGEPHVFIHELKVRLDLDLLADDATLADAWARALHAGVLRAIRSAAPGVEVFPDRAAFLAAFLEDRLGVAPRPDCFHEFDDLDSLPLGPLLVRVLAEEPDAGRDALLLMVQRGMLERILAALSEAEVETLVARCLLPAGPEVGPLQRVETWSEAIGPLLTGTELDLGSSVSRNVARTYLLLLRLRPDLGPDVHLARFVHDLMALRQRFLALDDQPAALAAVASARVGSLAGTPGGGRERRVLQALIARLSGPKTADLISDLVRREAPASRRCLTSFGGLFLLAGTLAELRIPEFLVTHPWPEEVEARLLVWLIAAGCLGPDNAEASLRDEGVALFSGLAGPPSSIRLAGCAERLTRADPQAFSSRLRAEIAPRLGHPGAPVSMDCIAVETERSVFLASPLLDDPAWARALGLASAAVLRSFATRLGAFSDSSVEYLRRNVLAAPGHADVFPDRIEVSLEACALQVVLRMAGLDEPALAPWLEARRIECLFP